MRKVKIPTSMNPFVVHVNGEKYVYPAGTEQEVTDAVANVIDAYIKKENQQPDPTESPFSTSWNDLKDKPFGEEKAFEPIVWDGNTEGLEVSESVSGKLVRISSLKITDPTNIENLVMFNIENGETATDPDFLVNQPVDGIFELQNGLVLLVNKTFQEISEGVWTRMIDDVPVRIAEINPKSIVKPLAEQYMPILTSPSGKKFKLSVDDSGVLSATEV